MSVKNHIRKRILEHIGGKCQIGYLPLKFARRRDGSGSNTDVVLLASELPSSQVFTDISEIKKDAVIENVSRREDRILFSVNNNRIIKDCFNNSSQKGNLEGKNILVEYSSPNIAKPFHFGHLRSTIVGNFVSNIVSKYDRVTRINYLGDWGTQIGYVKLGLGRRKEKEMSNPIKAMYEAYVEASNDPSSPQSAKEIFFKLENNDQTENKEWQSLKLAAVRHLEETYQMLGVRFDEYSCESNYRANSILNIFDSLLEEKKAVLNNGQMGMCINGTFVPLLRENRTTLYLSRDIAAALDRLKKYNCHQILYVVDKSQSNHLENLKQAVKNITESDPVVHIPFGKVLGMSTRKGTGIFLDDILQSVCQKMAEQQEKSPNTKSTDFETTRTLGLTCLFIYILKHGRNRDLKFNWDDALQGTGDSGVKLQYTHCRLYSLEETFGRQNKECDPSMFTDDVSIQLILLLSEFDDLLLDSKLHLESSFLVQYLFKLCNLTGRALKSLPVKNQPEDVAHQRLLLFAQIRRVVHNCMEILGLRPLLKM